MRTEKEIKDMIANIEEVFPEGKEVSMHNPINAYHIGVLAGLKSAVGDYESFVEMGMEDFMRTQFTEAGV